jgi:uncharacterized protein YndB with AHSA1/START domain
MNTPFIIERTFHAPVERVWEAITDKEKMKQWYFDLKEFRPVVGFRFEFDAGEEGKSFRHVCIITDVVINRKLAYTWRYEGYAGESKVTFELFPEGDKTRLRLTHDGLETFPKLSDFSKENFATGWNAIIGTHLKEFLEGNIENQN